MKGPLFVFAAALLSWPASAQEKITFQDHILPLVEANCAKCHNADKKKADLDLTSFQSALKGSGSGAIVLSGNPENSKLWKALTHAEEPFMPPNRPKLADKELELFKKWIAGGLLENATGKAISAAQSGMDLALGPGAVGKPDGPPPIPKELPIETPIHTARGSAITGLAASPWAPLLAVAGQKDVLLFHTDTLELLGILPFTEGQPVHLQFSRNGKLLLAAGGRAAKSGRVVVWDVVTGEHLMTLGDEYDTVLAADMRADQSQVALGGPSRLLKIISTRTGEVQHKIKKHTDWVTAIAFSPDGQMLASADRNGGLSIWDPDSGQELFTLAGHKSAVTALSWRPDSKLLASSSEDGTAKLWETKEGKQVKSWSASSPGSLSVSYSPDGQLVSCGRDLTVTLWDAGGGKPRRCEFFGNIPVRAVFSSDSKRVFGADLEGRLAAWTVADQKRIGELDPNPPLLVDRIAAARKLEAELMNRVTVAGTNIAAAQAQLTTAAASLDQAKQELAKASAEETSAHAVVQKLASQVTNAPPELPAQLAAASSAWGAARSKTGSANATVEARIKEVEAAKAKVAAAKAQSPDAGLAKAKTEREKLEASTVLTEAYQVRASVAAKKREHDQVAAMVLSSHQAQDKATNDLAAAKAAIVAAETQLRTAQAMLLTNEPSATRLASELKAEQARLDALMNRYRSAVRPPTVLAERTTL